MADITPTITGRKPLDNGMTGETSVLAWLGMGSSDTGVAVQLASYTDRSVQVGGTFGSGGTVVFEGSNDGENFITLTDPQANLLSKSAASIEAVQEATRYVRPRVTAGDGDTAINVYLFVRG